MNKSETDCDAGREIPEEYREMLHLFAGVPPEHPTPAALASTFWGYKRCLDRVMGGASIPPTTLALVAFFAGGGRHRPEIDDKPPSVCDMYRAGEIRFDDPVVAEWRGKTCNGVFRGVSADAKFAIVKFDGEADERQIEPTKVRAAIPAGV